MAEVTDPERKRRLREFRNDIIDDLDLDNGLLDTLLQKDLIKKRMAASIRGRGEGTKDFHIMNTKFIDEYLLKNDIDDFNKVLLCLKENKQMDLYNKLTGFEDPKNVKIERKPEAMKPPEKLAYKEEYKERYDRADRDPDYMYMIDNKKKIHGKALIINVQKNRMGTDVDRDNLIRVWEYLNFSVTVFNDEDDLTAAGIEDKVKQFANDPEMKNCQAIVVCLLAHGRVNQICGTDNEGVSLPVLFSYFHNNNKNIPAGVPRLFFIQACRVDDGEQGEHPYALQEGFSKIPESHLLTDFFFGYATPPGSKAFRGTITGSFYITGLATLLYKFAHKDDLQEIHTYINKSVAAEGNIVSGSEGYLRKKVFFFP